MIESRTGTIHSRYVRLNLYDYQAIGMNSTGLIVCIIVITLAFALLGTLIGLAGEKAPIEEREVGAAGEAATQDG